MLGAHKPMRVMLAAALLLPLVSMLIVPFFDTSEPRYAEMARVMAHSGDWITPWFSPGVPFWGKPPLSFWAQAVSMRWFGDAEWAVRLPSWICLLLSDGVLVLGLTALKGRRFALLAALIYSTCALVYVSAGAVLTDPFLALGTTLSLVAFAVLAGTAHRSDAAARLGWQYGFFLGLVIGLLAKGPLAAVLIFAPVGVWWVHARRARPWTLLPWGRGLLLTLALSLPWYVLAEMKTPGFLDYFLIGEHLRRFLDPGWAGDLYGSAHRRAYGTIWLYWLGATFPWGPLMLAAGIGAVRSTRIRAAFRTIAQDLLWVYWLTAALFTPLFFTLSANILWTYVLPSLAGFCVLAACLVDGLARQFSAVRSQRLIAVAAAVPLCTLVFSGVVAMNPDLRNTERGLVRYALRPQQTVMPLMYFGKPPFSAVFYSAGRVRQVTPAAFDATTPFYLAVPRDQQQDVARLIGGPLDPVYANKRYLLVQVSPGTATPSGHTP